MGARGRRGLLSGLSQLAGSTGRIADRRERRQQLAMQQASGERERQRLEAQLAEMDRERTLSALLSQARKDARARSVQGLVQSGSLSEALGPAYMASLEAELPAEALSRLLTPGVGRQSALTERSALAARLLGEGTPQYKRALFPSAFPTEPQPQRPRYQTTDEILSAISEQKAAKQALTDEELMGIVSNVPAIEDPVSPRLTPRLSSLMATAGPAREEAAGRRASELMRGGLAGAGVSASRVGMIEPDLKETAPAVNKTAIAKKQIMATIDSILAREVPDEATRNKIRTKLVAGENPAFNVLKAYAELPTDGNLGKLTDDLYDLSRKSSSREMGGLEALGFKVNRPFLGIGEPSVR